MAIERLAHARRTLRESEAKAAAGQATSTERGEQSVDFPWRNRFSS